VEVSEEQVNLTRALFAERKLACPPFYGSIRELLKAQGPSDTAFTKVPMIVQTSDRWTPNSGRRLAALGARGPPQSLSNLFQER
jgi:hypothetical protein